MLGGGWGGLGVVGGLLGLVGGGCRWLGLVGVVVGGWGWLGLVGCKSRPLFSGGLVCLDLLHESHSSQTATATTTATTIQLFHASCNKSLFFFCLKMLKSEARNVIITSGMIKCHYLPILNLVLFELERRAAQTLKRT